MNNFLIRSRDKSLKKYYNVNDESWQLRWKDVPGFSTSEIAEKEASKHLDSETYIIIWRSTENEQNINDQNL